MTGPDPEKLRIIAAWLRKLAEVTNAQNLTPPSPEKMGLLLDLLDAQFHSGVFNQRSLLAVASRFAWFPSFAELKAALAEWEEADELAAKWGHLRGRLEAAPTEFVPPGEADRRALAKEWDNPDGIRRNIRTCNGEERFLRMLAGLVARHAPQHMALIEPRFWPEWHKPEAAE